ncbi:hypothetical protein C7475_102507 [Chitinophaga sp. S165]|nr:hypothetical protein C7475_102507 [Chitinophaga sp. S165]
MPGKNNTSVRIIICFFAKRANILIDCTTFIDKKCSDLAQSKGLTTVSC